MEEPERKIVYEFKDRPHSFEFGKASARHKIYYNDFDELRVSVAEALKINDELKKLEGEL